MKKVGIVAVLALVGVLAAGCAGKSDRSVRSAAIGSSTPVSGAASISSPYLLSGAAIRVDSWDWNIKNSTSLISGSGLQAGKASPGAFSVTKNIDNASIALYIDAAQGKNLQSLVFKVGSVVTYAFTNVIVTSVHQSGSGSDGSEDVTFVYGAVKMQNSAAGVGTSGSWDFVQNIGG